MRTSNTVFAAARKGLVHGLIALGAVLVVPSAMGQFSFVEDFKGTTAPGWNFGNESGGYTPQLTAGAGIDPVGDGWLRMSTPGNNQSTYAYLDNIIPSLNNTVTVSFDYTVWGGTGADGLTVFLYDAAATFSPGAFGGSLGYANKTAIDGLAGGFVGVGLDTYGNYSNPTEGRNGGVGFIPDAVAVRGPGSGLTGYDYVDGAALSSPLQFASRPSATTPFNYYGVQVVVDENNNVTVGMDFDPSDGITYTTVLSTSLGAVTRPNELRLGFTAATGGLTNYHELRNLTIDTTAQPIGTNFWDDDSGDGLWGTAVNWVGDIVPNSNEDIFFGDDYGTGPESVDTQVNRTVRSLNFDNPYAYTINNNVINFDALTGINAINVSESNGVPTSPIEHTINSTVRFQNDLTITNTASNATLNLAGIVSGRTTGNINIEGGGTVKVSGDVRRVPTININDGTLQLGADNVIRNGVDINLGGGTLDTNDFNDRVGTLTLSASSTIELGGSTSVLQFANSSGTTWDPGALLSITGWDGSPTGGGNDQVIFLNNSSSLTATQLSQIRFINPTGYSAGTYTAKILANGEIVPDILAVPEPSTIIIGGLLALVGLGDVYRRYRKGKEESEEQSEES